MKLVEYDRNDYLVRRTLRLPPGDKLCTVDVIERVDDELVKSDVTLVNNGRK